MVTNFCRIEGTAWPTSPDPGSNQQVRYERRSLYNLLAGILDD
jgi:hypothetical protein